MRFAKTFLIALLVLPVMAVAQEMRSVELGRHKLVIIQTIVKADSWAPVHSHRGIVLMFSSAAGYFEEEGRLAGRLQLRDEKLLVNSHGGIHRIGAPDRLEMIEIEIDVPVDGLNPRANAEGVVLISDLKFTRKKGSDGRECIVAETKSTQDSITAQSFCFAGNNETEFAKLEN